MLPDGVQHVGVFLIAESGTEQVHEQVGARPAVPLRRLDQRIQLRLPTRVGELPGEVADAVVGQFGERACQEAQMLADPDLIAQQNDLVTAAEVAEVLLRRRQRGRGPLVVVGRFGRHRL